MLAAFSGDESIAIFCTLHLPYVNPAFAAAAHWIS